MRSAVRIAGIALAIGMVAPTLTGCAAAQQRALYRESRALGQAVRKQDPEAVTRRVLPGARATVDVRRLLADETSKLWGAALDRPTSVRPEAILFLAPSDPVAVVWTDEGWRFASDPADFYARGTPREALRSLVRASRNARWDRLIELAPRRYRMGLSAEDLRRAWTEGEQAKALRDARDQLAARLGDPIRADSHEAVLDLGGGRAARLEREGAGWVVVDF